MYGRDFHPGDLVWFDPGVGYVLPGEVIEFHKAAQVITVQAVINNVTKTFTLNNLSSVKTRQDLGQNGVEDMITLNDLNEASILWNLRIRYDNNNIYTYIGSILVAVNPYRMFDFYGLDVVSDYDGKILGTLSPHLFAIGAAAYNRLLAKDGENQVVMITGESGAGKTESTKLLLQYLAAVNKSASNLISEQILEASPLLESFGNAKTVRNDNSSRFGKFLEVLYKDGVISGAKISDYLLEKSRIVSHAPDERNYHVFYELIAGLNPEKREQYGLMTAEKYFYLNQGGSCQIDGKNDREDFEGLQSAMQVLGFTGEEEATIFKILSSILHLGNVYFHRKQLKHGQEGVEIGSDIEIKWTAHLLQLNIHGISRALVMKMTEVRGDTVKSPLNIDQALDARDAIAKALYSSLFTWLITRVNKICSGKAGRRSSPHKSNDSRARMRAIAILDMFGFEDFPENSFEQLCINFANEQLQHHFIKTVFKYEQAEYAKESLEWTPIGFNDNNATLSMLAKKPVGIFHLLDDESNFPKASDLSFLEKCHYNHALNELYSRPRMSSMEFGVKHYAGQVWYNVEGFLDKNRDTLRYDVMSLLISSRDKLISKMFLDLRNVQEASRTSIRSSHDRSPGGSHLVTMKPRAPTVAARFLDSMHQLLHNVSQSNAFYIRCIKPNNHKLPMKFDMPVVLEQLRYLGALETVKIRKLGYPVRMKYQAFAQRYRCLVQGIIPRGAPYMQIARIILEREEKRRDLFALGGTKVFMREELEKKLEKEREEIMEVEVLKVQRVVRGHLARKHFLTKKKNAIKIQAAFRGYQVRKEYSKVRKGFVALQAIYRMRRQQMLYTEMKHEMKRRSVLEAEQRKLRAISEDRQSKKSLDNLNASPRILSASNRSSPGRSSVGGLAVASVNHLEVPAQLAFILRKLESGDWEPVNSERNLAKVSGDVARKREKSRLPHDIDYYSFSKLASIYFKSHIWQMKRDPIKTPFLSKSKDSDYNESLAIFKLILRFMNDEKLSGYKEKVLSDYIVNKGIQNEKLRDEIFCQIANQTWKNENERNCERGWLLMANCMSAFPPSKLVYKYLLKYVSDHGYNGYKNTCQQKLLKAGKLSTQHTSRQYPPTILEWRANKKRLNMALECKFSDGFERHTALESFTTCEEFAATALGDRGIPEIQGWTVSLEDGDTQVEMNGGDFVFDAIGEMELPPAFPMTGKPNFIITHDKSRGQLPLIINTGPHNNPTYRYNGSTEREVDLRKQRAKSEDRLLAEFGGENQDDFGVLSKSVLNGRYFEEKSGAKSKSLDNLLTESAANLLSGSRLNRRYRDMENLSPEDLELESISQRGGMLEHDNGKSKKMWDDIGLSKTPLNDRYFSQPDLVDSNERDELEVMRPRSQAQMAQLEEEALAHGKSRLHGNPRHVKGQRRVGRYDKSSAMSDTSEAPSVASHVRGVRVPSQASDVDQFLDDLFMPVLDGNIDDGLSDAKSLAASMRGGSSISDENDLEVESFSRAGSMKRTSVLKQGLDVIETEHKTVLEQVVFLMASLRGGKDTPENQDKSRSNASNMGFQPIPGVISPTPMMGGMMSPPPMLMPTPVHSMIPSSGSGAFQPGPGMSTGGPDNPHPAMAFTYVPVPVYNLGGMSMPGFQGVMPPTSMGGGFYPGAVSSPASTQHQPSSPNKSKETNKDSSESNADQSSLEQQQFAYQQAFLQNAVAQNMQIQQQLMMQNQALTQLLGQSGSSSYQGSFTGTPMTSMMSPQGMFNQSARSGDQNQSEQKTPTGNEQRQRDQEKAYHAQQEMYFGMVDETQRRASADHLKSEMKHGGYDFEAQERYQKSKSFPNTPKTSSVQPPDAPMMPSGSAMDPYTRARTVRIGKWRWPPPKDESVDAEGPVEGFFEFKMRKMHERKMMQMQKQQEQHQQMQKQGSASDPMKLDDDDIDGIDWRAEYENELNLRKLRKSQSKDSFSDFKDDNSEGRASRASAEGKLKLTNELKSKLEAVTGGSRKSSMRSTNEEGKPRRKSGRSDEDDEQDQSGVKRLSENRKMLLEQQLGAGKKKRDAAEAVRQTMSDSSSIPKAPVRTTSSGSLGGPPPPPPPPLPPSNKTGIQARALPEFPKELKEELKSKQRKDSSSGSSSSSSSSSSSPYSPAGSLPRPEGRPPPVIKPSDVDLRKDRRSSMDIERNEKIELEESSEFLQPVDTIPKEDDYETLERIKTAIHPPYSPAHISYNRVPWNLKIRKEVFAPSETVNSPMAINLIFCQIVQDVFSPLCIRLSTEERTRMKTLLDEYDIDLKNVFSQKHKLSTKKNIIDMAKEFSVYFARLYPLSSGKADEEPEYLAVSHSGVRLVKRQKGVPTDYFKVLEAYHYEDIGEVSTIKHNGLQVVMHTGERVVVNTDKAAQIKDMLNRYMIESSSGQFDYVKALADFSSRDKSTLNFKKGEILAIIPRRDAYTEKGWLYGIKDGQYGLLPSDFVERMSPSAVKREMRVIAKVTQAKNRVNSEESEIDSLEEDEIEEKRKNDFDRSIEPDYSGQEEESWEVNKRRLPKISNGKAADDEFHESLPVKSRDDLSEVSASAANVVNDGKNPLLEFAMNYFREREKFSSISEGKDTKKSKKLKKKKSSAASDRGDWTWKDQTDMVKWTDKMITNSLLRLEPSDLNKMGLECFACIMRYMGDLPLLKNQHEVDCVNTILMYCHKFEPVRDEVYCQIMKQTTNNKSPVRESCQKGWRLFSIIAAYFTCSELLKPYLFKYLETAAYDKRRAYHGTALVCLHNLRKTFKYGGRKNVPSIEEITAISAGRSSKRQIYRLPGGTERVINTKSTTVVENIIEELCEVIGVDTANEREEFSLYCIVEGETFTVPLAKEHYILDVTTELQRDGAIYYLIFCRSVWYYPLRIDNQLYTEVVFNQIAPDYLEGLLLVMPGGQIDQDFVYDISKIAALLHKAADMDHQPTIKETKFLLPKPALSSRDIKPPQWVNMVQSGWEEIKSMSPNQAKAKVLEVLSEWPLFGSSFFAVRRESDVKDGSEHILALNKNGVSFLDMHSHETVLHYPFTEVISTRKVQIEDGTLFLDMKCGNLMQQRITRIQTEQANEIARLIRQYITIDQRLRGNEAPVEEKRGSPSR